MHKKEEKAMQERFNRTLPGKKDNKDEQNKQGKENKPKKENKNK